MAKLSDVVTFIRRSPQLREAFSFQVQHTAGNASADYSADNNPLFQAHNNIQLCNNNDTRGNSTFYVIELALRLKMPLQSWIGINSMERADRRLPTEKRLTEEDWEVL